MTGPESAHPAARPVIEHLALVANPAGGWFRQVHECRPRRREGRSLATVINYLLDVSRPLAYLHRTSADAVHYFHQGSPLAVTTVSPDGGLRRQVLGRHLDDGQSLQVVVAGGTWKALELAGGPWALISEAVSPGWEATDHQEATPALYQRDHPHLREAIRRLIRDPDSGPSGPSERGASNSRVA